jgi:hypothetical protein
MIRRGIDLDIVVEASRLASPATVPYLSQRARTAPLRT